MSGLAASIECTTSWENVGDLTFSGILMCTEAQDNCIDTIRQASEVGEESADVGVRLRPSQNPPVSGRCEVRLSVPPRLHRRIAKVAIRSSARNTEVYDRQGEYLLTAKGDKGGGQWRWYTTEFVVPPSNSQLLLKFLSLSEEQQVRLQLLHLVLEPHTWPNDLPGASPSSAGLDLHRVHELTNFGERLSPSARQLLAVMGQQRQPDASPQIPVSLLSGLLARQHLGEVSGNRQTASSPSSSSPESSEITRWLDERLLAIETRIMDRLDDICLRLSALETNRTEARPD